MSALEKAYETARAAKRRVVMPEVEDPRTEEAAARLAAEGLAERISLDAARPAAEYVEFILRARPKTKPALAEKMLAKPMVRAAAMVAAGEADALIAGAATPTRRVIEAASLTIGLAEGVTAPSSFFLMAFPDGRELIFADCAVNVAPDAATLASIARSAAVSADALLDEARVVMLSFSTLSSGSGARPPASATCLRRPADPVAFSCRPRRFPAWCRGISSARRWARTRSLPCRLLLRADSLCNDSEQP